MNDKYARAMISYSKVFKEKLSGSRDTLLLLSVYQAIYRLFAANNEDYAVLHASAAFSKNGSCVVFGDDGRKARGKTFCALELATTSGKFISDEYVLFRKSDNHIFGNGYIPINLKGDIAKHFRDEHEILLKDQKIVFATNYFEIPLEALASFLVVPYLGATTTKLVIPTRDQQIELYRATAFGHSAKLLKPELDRTSVLTGKDEDIEIDMKETLKDFPNIESPIPVYVAQLKKPCDINKVVKEIENGTRR